MNVENDKLAWEIINYLLEFGYIPDAKYDCVYDWLNLCTNIKHVEFDVGKYDEGLLYCGSAWDYALEQMNILESINIKLIQFMYAWCALETIIEVQVDEQSVLDKGKINATCFWLKNNLRLSDIPSVYLKIYDEMIEQLKLVYQFEAELQKLGITENSKFPNKKWVNKSGAGLLVVYKIRNKLAHGSLIFPTPDDIECGDTEEHISPKLIDSAISIVLFSIVMLLLVDCKKFDNVIDDAVYCEKIAGMTPSNFLRNIQQFL